MSIIRLKDVAFHYLENPVLKNICLEIARGEIIGVIGPNGSGKTTLLKIMGGLLAPRAGEVQILGKDMGRMKPRDVARRLAFVPQEFSTSFPFNVRDIVAMGRAPHMGRLQFENGKDRRIIAEAMELTHISALAGRMMDQISGGERQRALIARAIAQQPEIILFDEATAFLDIKYQLGLFELISRLNTEQGLTVIVVTHDINLAALYAHRILLLRDGEIYGNGSPLDVVTEKNLRIVYEVEVLVDKNPQTGRPRVTLRKNGGPSPSQELPINHVNFDA